jgi:hypothetical protein
MMLCRRIMSEPYSRRGIVGQSGFVGFQQIEEPYMWIAR